MPTATAVPTWIDATGDVVTGDMIRFTEGVFSGSFRRPKFIGNRIITARVVKDSYGDAKQQHTFALVIIHSYGVNTDEIKVGSTLRRKGRNVYRNGTERLLWDDENKRESVAYEKHCRGHAARQDRAIRNGQMV